MQTGMAVGGSAASEAVMEAENAPSTTTAAAAASMHPQGSAPLYETGEAAPAHVDRLYQASLLRHLCTMLQVRQHFSAASPKAPSPEGGLMFIAVPAEAAAESWPTPVASSRMVPRICAHGSEMANFDVVPCREAGGAGRFSGQEGAFAGAAVVRGACGRLHCR